MGKIGTADEDHGVGEVVIPHSAIRFQQRFVGDVADRPGRAIEVDVVAIGAGIERGKRDQELTCGIGPRYHAPGRSLV